MRDTTTIPEVQSRPSTTRMYTVVMSVGIACAAALVVVYDAAIPIIERNRHELRRQAILAVLPRSQTTETFQLNDDGVLELAASDADTRERIFAGFDEHEQLVGFAIEAQGVGYQDVVRVIYGYSFEQQAIIGLRVLESRETPGIGDRVETDPAFQSNFVALAVDLTADGSELSKEIEFVRSGERRAAWQIDGISGATVTSRAIADMVAESASQWIPRVNRQLGELERETKKSRSTTHVR